MRSFIFFTSVLCLANCFNEKLITTRSSAPENQGDLGIYGGTSINIEQFPYVVSILGNGKPYCAGTIMSDGWILTIGDCVHGMDKSLLKIVAASNDGQTGDTYNVSTIVMHPKYDKSYLDYNAACVKIDGVFKFSSKVQPAKLPGPTKANTTVNVGGYGATAGSEDVNEGNGRLMGGVMFWQSTAFCKQTYKDFGFQWTPRMGCAYNKGKTTLCSGDFGDPAICNGTLFGSFIAIASQGMCSTQALPTIMCATHPIARWIKKTTGAKYINE